jgi:hypothetical protein
MSDDRSSWFERLQARKAARESAQGASAEPDEFGEEDDAPGDESAQRAGAWRQVVGDEIFPPGRTFRINVVTGHREVLEHGDGIAPSLAVTFELTVLAKDDGPLTKRIYLDTTGKLISDGGACVMARGVARRERVVGLAAFAALIAGLGQHEAIALGALRHKLPERVHVTTKAKLNGGGDPNLIARTSGNIYYRDREPALVLIDYDSKGMSGAVKSSIDAAGGVWEALVGIVPELATAGHVIRPSTSAGLYRSDTGDQLPGSQNSHIYLLVQNGADAGRFLRALHARCWLAGIGWMMVGAGGQLLERSIVDRMVYAPERLVFEGPPVVVAPVAQDRDTREPVVVEGEILDTVTACRPLSIVEGAEFDRLRAVARRAMGENAKKAREVFVANRADALSKCTGMPLERARRIIASQCGGVLLPDVELPFDDPELKGKTVADVLADPERFEGETLADPLEGIEYGTCKARIMRDADGSVWIDSFAHGRTVYRLKLDASAVRMMVEKAPKAEVAATFLHAVLNAEMADDEIEQLRAIASELSGINVSTLTRMLKEADKKQKRERAEATRERQLAERTDPRVRLDVPRKNAEWTPVMNALNEVLGASQADEPPMRDVDGYLTGVKARRLPNMHELTAAGANAEEAEQDRLEAPEQPMLTRLTGPQAAELIERYIEYLGPKSTAVHLPTPFVGHYQPRPYDDALPLVAAVSTLPLVLPGRIILSGPGLMRERGIVFRVPTGIMKLLPRLEECTEDTVRKAYRFLCHNWLCDVAADSVGKAIIISAALALIERSLLANRPAYFVTAGRRGGGKTTLLIMLLMAVTGVHPPAAAWSPNEEERRKALVTYLEAGLAAIIWDNIPRGAQISCPHIERACTTAWYSDRRLGVNELISVAASTIMLFTGNNIGPRGDLASRALRIPLEITRHDPENRPFRHPDPLGWTLANRAGILRSLYILLLSNPLLQAGSNSQGRTRFKEWHRLCGAAVEHAAGLDGTEIDFQKLFLTQEEDEPEGVGLGEMLAALAATWPGEFQAHQVAAMVNDRSEYTPDAERARNAAVREFLYPEPPHRDVSPKSVGKQLQKHIGNPVQHGGATLTLRSKRDTAKDGANAALKFAVSRQQP